jgi:hypothetical protein
MANTFNPGDEVYSVHGEAGRYVARVASGYVVEPIIEPDDREEAPYYADPVTWREVFAKPPVQRLHAEVAEVEKKLGAARDALAEVRAARSEFDAEERARQVRIKQHQRLAALDDFLAGRITHFVHISPGYRAPKIQSFDETMVREERRSGRELRLLGLFGDVSRGLRWKVTTYGDGSGSTDEVIPCTSLEQAQALLIELVSSGWDAIRRDGRYYAITETVDLARQIGVNVPLDLADKAAQIARDGAKSTLNSRREEFERAQRQLADAEAGARAAGLDLPPAAAAA